MLTVITGPMFSGKTTELIRRLRCARIANQRTLVIKPAIDTRSGHEIMSHNGVSLKACVLDRSARALPVEGEFDVLGIDESQFLDAHWISAITRLCDQGVEVVCACLNLDYLGRPFGISPQLLALADEVVHLKAVCTGCGSKNAATRSHRVSGGDDQVEIGGSDKYKALCRGCWVERNVALEPAVAAVA